MKPSMLLSEKIYKIRIAKKFLRVLKVPAISANDADALESSLTEALNSGIEVISVDAPVNSISRKTHIQQADPEVLGRNFIKSAYDVSNGEGGFAILTSTGSAPN